MGLAGASVVTSYSTSTFDFSGDPTNLAVVESRTDISDRERVLRDHQATKASKGNETCLTRNPIRHVRMIMNAQNMRN